MKVIEMTDEEKIRAIKLVIDDLERFIYGPDDNAAFRTFEVPTYEECYSKRIEVCEAIERIVYPPYGVKRPGRLT